MQITLIIPMYNEKKIIKDTAGLLSQYMEESFDSYEILFSDDGSTDGSKEAVESLNLPCVRVIRNDENRGKGHAIRTAMLAAQGEWVLFTDADLAYGTEVIGAIWEHTQSFEREDSAELIIGSRTLHSNGYAGYTPLRRLMSKGYIRMLGLVGGFRLTDSQCGCKAFSQKASKEIFSRCQVNGFAFDYEAILWAERLGYKTVEFPVCVINHRESKVQLLRDSVRMLRDVRRIRKRIRREAEDREGDKK